MRIGGDFADAQMIILEHLEAPPLLHSMMLTLGSPAHHRFLVTPDRQRQHQPVGVFGAETLVVDEAVDGFELRSQLLRQRQIVVPTIRLWFHFKNDGEHCVPPLQVGSVSSCPSRKMLVSRHSAARMRSRCIRCVAWPILMSRFIDEAVKASNSQRASASAPRP